MTPPPIPGRRDDTFQAELMEILPIISQLQDHLRQTSLAEMIAVITGMASVWFARKESILVFPVGIISVLLYVWLCFHAGLYADMGINAFYFLMSVYGWVMWTTKSKVTKKPRCITRSSATANIAGFLGMILFTAILYNLLVRFTDSSVPFLDAFTTALFIIGMWQMALKKLENWLYWIAGDVVCLFLFPYKGLVFSGLQYLVFLVLAISAWIEWRRKLNLRIEPC